MNYYSFHIGDYATHTRYLDLLSDLAYRRLLDLYYTSEAPITLDVDKASALIGMREHSEIVSEVLSNFFLKSEDGYRNARCDAEIEVYHAKADRARSANTKRWDSKKAPDSLKSDLKSEQSRIPTNNKTKPLRHLSVSMNLSGMILLLIVKARKRQSQQQRSKG